MGEIEIISNRVDEYLKELVDRGLNILRGEETLKHKKIGDSLTVVTPLREILLKKWGIKDR